MHSPEDHLVTGLLHGAAGNGAGSYNNYDAWAVTLGGGDVTSNQAQLVTVHEALHAALNDCTSFGTSLAAYAVLGLDDPDRRLALTRLVDMCRTVHEAFATYQSIWLVGGGDLALLKGYPSYIDWYRDASDLVGLPDHFRSKEMMIEAAVRACMQSRAVDHLLRRGLTVDVAETVPPLDRPNVRFDLLHRHADAAFWSAAWSRCCDAVGDTPAWRSLRAGEDDPSLRKSTYSSEYQATWMTIAHLLHEEVTTLLGRHGAEVLSYDGHRDFTAELIAAVEQVAPRARGRLIASEDSATAQDESFEMWRRERLVVTSHPRPAVLHQLAGLPRDRHIVLVSVRGRDAHVFATARPAFRLLQQFEFSAPDRAYLQNLGCATVVTARSAASDDEPVDLTVLEDPGQLKAIVSAWNGSPRVFVNVALSSLGDIAWRDRWSGALRRTQLTGLLDLSPFAQFDLWRQDGEPLAYVRGTVRDVDSRPCAVFACIVGDTNLPLLLPCTGVTAQILEQYLEQTFPAAVEDLSLLEGSLETVQLTMSHLLAEEHSFDVSAYHWEEPGGQA
ncbi:hypothetical protein ACGFJC_53200 [Nonomuraea fuscirosea]|uniref:hypothetical protein n=1 Tax=Nonomuraea fuscirosea TaxID=1291556 RepID=UPI003470DCE6